MRGARREQGTNRHVLYLSQEQMESVAYGFWLHRMSGSALEANRFARDYNVAHDPAPAPQAPARTPDAMAAVPSMVTGHPGVPATRP
ncbi:DUF6417 family protein [Streptomyces rishiriensis]|uniref:DUF6417 family protein n=1 Tax=Streptomyces rishiriensis TaxID=68264 RepID=UPI0037A78A26